VFDEALSEVWIKIQSSSAAEETARHEVRHCWQLAGDRYKSAGLLTMEQRQRDADAFAASWSLTDVPRVVDQARARAEWERRWRPVHEATRVAYAERAQAARRGPMMRPHATASVSSTPKFRTVDGVTQRECEQCGEWMAPGVLHRCPAARGLVPMKGTAQGKQGRFGHVPYSVKAL